MVRMGQDAIDYARGQIGPNSMPDSGLCLQFTRQCFDVGSYYYSAIDAWNACIHPHPGDRNIPAAVPVWFASSSIYDHIAFYVSDSEVITTFNADVRALSWDSMLSTFGPFYGWGEDLNTVRVYQQQGGGGEVTAPVGEDENMRLIRVIQDGRIFLVTSTLFQQVGDMKTANALAAIYGTWLDMDVTDADAIHNQINSNIVATVDNLQGQVNS